MTTDEKGIIFSREVEVTLYRMALAELAVFGELSPAMFSDLHKAEVKTLDMRPYMELEFMKPQKNKTSYFEVPSFKAELYRCSSTEGLISLAFVDKFDKAVKSTSPNLYLPYIPFIHHLSAEQLMALIVKNGGTVSLSATKAGFDATVDMRRGGPVYSTTKPLESPKNALFTCLYCMGQALQGNRKVLTQYRNYRSEHELVLEMIKDLDVIGTETTT